jgi:hypothetical protein
MGQNVPSNTERQYLMIVYGEKKEERWLSLQEAGVLYDNGYLNVEIGGRVREPDNLTRPISQEERDKIRDIADQVSGSK